MKDFYRPEWALFRVCARLCVLMRPHAEGPCVCVDTCVFVGVRVRAPVCFPSVVLGGQRPRRPGGVDICERKLPPSLMPICSLTQPKGVEVPSPRPPLTCAALVPLDDPPLLSPSREPLRATAPGRPGPRRPVTAPGPRLSPAGLCPGNPSPGGIAWGCSGLPLRPAWAVRRPRICPSRGSVCLASALSCRAPAGSAGHR